MSERLSQEPSYWDGAEARYQFAKMLKELNSLKEENQSLRKQITELLSAPYSACNSLESGRVEVRHMVHSNGKRPLADECED